MSSSAVSDAVDTTIAVITPENIAFDYQLAGPFRRFPAYLVDLLVRGLILLGVMVLLFLSMAAFSMNAVGAYAVAFFMLANFALSFFYGAFCEAYFNGRTVGKAVCGIRVIDVEGRPINGSKAMLRNLLRPADMLPLAPISWSGGDYPPQYILPTGMVAILVMICTRRMQRLGDLAAGTMVIIDEKQMRLPIARVDDPRVPALASYIPADYRVSRSMAKMLAAYIERRSYLTPARRREIARHLTNPLVDRFEFRRDIDPDLLLYTLYYQTFLVDSSTPAADLSSLSGYSPLAKDADKTTAVAEMPDPEQRLIQQR